MSNVAQIGHNNPPEKTPFDDVKTRIEDLYDEAKLWLDGEKVETQAQADALNTLASRIKEAAKDAEALRKEEVKPFDDGKAEVQARYNLLIGETKTVTGKSVAALDAVKAALKPYLIELDRIQQEAADKARKEAEEAERVAREAMQSRDHTNLEESEEAERLVLEAKSKQADASKAEKTKAHAKGEGRATGLRTVWKAQMTDEKAAAAWMWTDHRTELMEFVQEQANKAVRAGKRQINGFSINETKEL